MEITTTTTTTITTTTTTTTNNKLQLPQYESKATTSTQSGKVISIHTHPLIALVRSLNRPHARSHDRPPRHAHQEANREIDLIITRSPAYPPSNTIIINLFIDQNELSSTRENDIKQKKRKKTKLSMNKKKQGEI